MRSRSGLVRTLALGAVLALAPSVAFAQPAWIVGTSGAPVSSPASTTVLLRHRTLTVATIALEYVGPAEPIAVVLPVGGAIDAAHVHVVPHEVLERLDQVSSPRLVERWERDPCDERTREGETGLTHPADQSPSELAGIGMGHGSGGGTGSGYGEGAGRFGGDAIGYGVAEHGERLTQGDYTIEVVTADALASWLSEHGFVAPADLAAAIDALGVSHYVVARLTEGRAHLPALRVEYQADALSLPLVSSGDHDLVVEVLASTRFDVTGHGVLAPTGIAVVSETSARFAGVYAAVLDRLLLPRPEAVVTEHAWSAASCEGCPGARAVRAADLATLGGFVAFPAGVEAFHNRGFSGRETMVPTVRFGDADVRGSLSREVIHRVVQRHLDEARFCYEQQLVQRPDLGGHVTMSFIIGATGAVQFANVQNTTLNDAQVQDCLVSAFRRWTFPAPEGGGIVGVNLPITFASTGGGGGRDPTAVGDWILTRLHAHLASGAARTWTLDAADAIEGGREREDASAEPTRPRFETRFVIRHPWDGAIACDTPTRDVWGAPMGGHEPDPISATRGARAVDDATLAASITVPLDSIGLAAPPPPSSEAPSTEVAAPPPPSSTAPAAHPTPSVPTGCGCRARAGGSEPLALVIVASLVLARRRTLRARGRNR